MTDNTLENKAKFFALYWGQKVFKYLDGFNTESLYKVDHIKITEPLNGYLLLKPLSSITDEDAIEIGYGNAKDLIYEESRCYLDIKEADYLRSKGYAVSWLDLSVEDLVDYKWIKIV